MSGILTRLLLIGATVGIGLSERASAQQAAQVDDTVLILQTVQTNYSDPITSLQSVNNALPAQTTVRPLEGLSSVISRLYSIGPSNAPDAYDQMAATIRSWNNLPAGDKLIAGQTLDVPDVPKIARTQPGLANPYNAIPKLSLDRRLEDRVTVGALNLDRDRQIEEGQRRGAKAVVVMRKMTTTEARATLAQDGTAIVAEAPLHLHFLDASGQASPTLLSPAEAQVIRSASLGPTHQRPVMVVFDDTWPDRDSEEASRAYVLRAVQTLRNGYNLPPMASFDPGCRVGVSMGTWPVTAAKIHAAQIKQSLKPLMDAAGTNTRITVLYLPALAGGPCVNEVLGQLIELHLLTRHLGAQLGQGVPATLVVNYHQMTQSILAKLRTHIDADGGDSDVETISAVLDFARRYGAAISQPIFTSMSWEFKFDDWQPLVPSEYPGLFVVAAGNDGIAKPVIVSKAQFAGRSAHPGDTLAVMNVDKSGRFTCDTSVVDPTNNAFATSFNGWLSDEACGTSFSAPRVAWLLALKESTRAPLPDLTNLPIKIRADLTAAGMTTVTANGGTPLDIAALFR